MHSMLSSHFNLFWHISLHRSIFDLPLTLVPCVALSNRALWKTVTKGLVLHLTWHHNFISQLIVKKMVSETHCKKIKSYLILTVRFVVWTLKVEFHWRKGKQKNWKINNTQRFLTFISHYYCFSIMMSRWQQCGKKLVCGLWYHVWCINTEMSHFIEKMVSRRTEKSSTLNAFLSYLSCRCCNLIIVSRRRKRRGKNLSVGCVIMCGMLALKIAISLKKGERKNWKIINTQRFLTILFVSLLLFYNS